VRRGALAVLGLVLIAGLLGLFGVHTREVSAQGLDGYELTVRYADRARPGLAAPWSVEVRRAEGFDTSFTIATTAAYFDLFDENGLDPEPASATVDGEMLLWEFEPPEGQVLELSFDARIEPAVQSLWPPEAVTRLIVEGETIAEVRYRTRVFP
jgi:hypothetical protein